MTTVLTTHAACLQHDTGAGHPEAAARLAAILRALGSEDFSALARRDASVATEAQLRRVHSSEHIAAVRAAIPVAGTAALDADTILSPGSWDAALRAAGAVCDAVDMVVRGAAKNAFCAVRPPGHHAEPDTPMGFCLFNNVAVGAAQAQAVHGLRRVAVIDIDVHHGNGTQAWAWDKPDIFYASTHQFPLYPGTGAAHEEGKFGAIVNAPLAPGSGGSEFRAALKWKIFPALEKFAPDLIMISAGFDAHAADPLSSLRLDEDDYVWATAELAALAARLCEGRLVSVLEGGYDVEALARSVAAHVRALMAT